MLEIREYRPATDTPDVRACLVELQDYERMLEPALLEGDQMADAHLAHLLAACRDREGRIFVAVEGSRVIGIVCVWARVAPHGPDDVPFEHAYISDLSVLDAYRRHGIGHALLERAEAFAREHGATIVRVGVRWHNTAARRLYAAAGFAEDRIELAKPLVPRTTPTTSS